MFVPQTFLWYVNDGYSRSFSLYLHLDFLSSFLSKSKVIWIIPKLSSVVYKGKSGGASGRILWDQKRCCSSLFERTVLGSCKHWWVWDICPCGRHMWVLSITGDGDHHTMWSPLLREKSRCRCDKLIWSTDNTSPSYFVIFVWAVWCVWNFLGSELQVWLHTSHSCANSQASIIS